MATILEVLLDALRGEECVRLDGQMVRNEEEELT